MKTFAELITNRYVDSPHDRVLIACEACELQALVRLATEHNMRWLGDVIPSKAIIEGYSKKPAPGLIIYDDDKYCFHESKIIRDGRIKTIVNFNDIVGLEHSASIQPNDVFRLIEGA